jgi:hypothetical protein
MRCAVSPAPDFDQFQDEDVYESKTGCCRNVFRFQVRMRLAVTGKHHAAGDGRQSFLERVHFR